MNKIDLLLSFFSLLLTANCFAQKDSTQFVTSWKTDNSGISNDSAIFIDVDSLYSYNFDIDWDNDGVFDTVGVTGSILIQYPSPGTYTLRIKGLYPTVYFNKNQSSDLNKITSIDQWGTNPWQTLVATFLGCFHLTSTATDAPNLSNITDISFLFWGASNFTGDLGNWDVSTIRTMNRTFTSSGITNSNIGNWDVSNVTEMQSLFDNAFLFNDDISNWDVSRVKNMGAMFSSTISFNQDISSWNVDSVNNMSYMFYGSVFNQDISSWDVSFVTNMSNMFNGAISFNQDLSNWNLQSVTNMTDMLNNSGLSRTNYDNALIGWQAQAHPLNVSFGSSGLIYCLGDSARSLLMNDGWTFSGDSLDCQAIGFEENKMVSNIQFYPNPAKNKIIIESEVSIIKVNIYSVLGSIVKTSKETSFLIEDLPDGNYIIEIVTKFGNKREFLVKQ